MLKVKTYLNPSFEWKYKIMPSECPNVFITWTYIRYKDDRMAKPAVLGCCSKIGTINKDECRLDTLYQALELLNFNDEVNKQILRAYSNHTRVPKQQTKLGTNQSRLLKDLLDG